MHESWSIIFTCDMEKALRVAALQALVCKIKCCPERQLEPDLALCSAGAPGWPGAESLCPGAEIAFQKKPPAGIFSFSGLAL